MEGEQSGLRLRRQQALATLRKTAASRRPSLARPKFLIAFIVVFGALAFLGYNAFQASSMYYLSVGELLARGDAAYGEELRVSGKVVEGTTQRGPEANAIRFTMTDDAGPSVPVVYQGVVPDTFQDGGEVVVEGGLSPEGVFRATTLLAKCPSKYEPEESKQG
jgi:cytochrome c-type biogenesis protein CcmE